MKLKSLISLSCLLTIVCSLFVGCPRVRTYHGTGAQCGDPRNRDCEVIIITHFGPGNEFSNQMVSSASGVIDLANGWQPSVNGNSHAVVKLTKTNGQLVQSSFPTTLTSSNISSVDKNTTPHAYVFQNQSDVNNFVNQSLAGDSSANIDIEFTVPIILNDCSISTGKYINHIRYSDSSGVTYLDSFNLIYSVLDNIQGANRCDQATVTIE